MYQHASFLTFLRSSLNLLSEIALKLFCQRTISNSITFHAKDKEVSSKWVNDVSTVEICPLCFWYTLDFANEITKERRKWVEIFDSVAISQWRKKLSFLTSHVAATFKQHQNFMNLSTNLWRSCHVIAMLKIDRNLQPTFDVPVTYKNWSTFLTLWSRWDVESWSK